jgi:hypothetical protein
MENASNPYELPGFLLLPGENGAEKAGIRSLYALLGRHVLEATAFCCHRG